MVKKIFIVGRKIDFRMFCGFILVVGVISRVVVREFGCGYKDSCFFFFYWYGKFGFDNF